MNRNKLSHCAHNFVVGLLIALAMLVIVRTLSFIFSDTWASWSAGKIFSMAISLFIKAFVFTIPSLLLPFLIYIMLQIIVRNSLLRITSGVGCLYIFYLLNGGISVTAPVQSLRLSFQVYFLMVLIMPQEIMTVIGAFACMAGSIIINIFPDLPGTLDDLAAICTLIAMVFIYINTLATFIKRQLGERLLNFTDRSQKTEHKQQAAIKI